MVAPEIEEISVDRHEDVDLDPFISSQVKMGTHYGPQSARGGVTRAQVKKKGAVWALGSAAPPSRQAAAAAGQTMGEK